MIRIENVYQMKKSEDARRFLIDKKWPRGVVRFIPHKEENGRVKGSLAEIKWRPQLAPDAALWNWFEVNPDKIDRFRRRYFKEIQEKKKYWLPLAQAAQKGEVVLLYRPLQSPWTPAHFFKEFLHIQLRGNHLSKPDRMTHTDPSVRGVAVPVEKAISRKSRLPIKPERRLKLAEKRDFVPAGERRTVVVRG